MTLIENKQFIKWFVKWFFLWAGSIFIVLFFSEAIFLALGGTLNDTDLSPVKRSGLKVHTDYKNGCQYLSTSNYGLAGGGLMARYAPDGSHMGCIQGLPLPVPSQPTQPMQPMQQSQPFRSQG